jgi:hypothetical protein
MTKYIVHLYREMRLSFADIEADTAEAAAAFAREKSTDEADDIEDCNGEDSSALVDLAGDEDYRHSVTIDFEGERIRKAAAKLLEDLKAMDDAFSHYCEYRQQSDDETSALVRARATIAKAEAAGIRADSTPVKHPARFEIEHDPLENPDRAYVLVDGKFDVAIIRTGEGIVIDVYPKDWIDPIDSLTVWDEEVAAASAEAKADHAGEA